MLGMAKIMREYSDDDVLGAVGQHEKFPKGQGWFKAGDVDVEVHPRREGGHRVTVTQTFDFEGDSLIEAMEEPRLRAAGWRKS
jgi:hypothetical protein